MFLKSFVFGVFAFATAGFALKPEQDPRIRPLIEDHFPGQDVRIAPLSGGYSPSENYRLDVGGRSYVLRLHSNGELKQRMRRELFSFQEAARVGVAPTVYWSSESGDAFLTDFIEGKTPTIEKIKGNIERIAKGLAKIHALPKNPIGRDGVFARSLKLIDRNPSPPEILLRIAKEANQIFQELSKKGYPAATLHEDLHAGNLFITEDGVKFIDWSETNWDDPYYDLAEFALLNDLTADEERLFLQSYLDRAPTAEELDHYGQVKRIKFVCFAANLLLLADELTREEEIPLQETEALADWSFYVWRFADDPEQTPQFFHDWGLAALQEFDAYPKQQKRHLWSQ